jgi:hypothetical protein
MRIVPVTRVMPLFGMPWAAFRTVVFFAMNLSGSMHFSKFGIIWSFWAHISFSFTPPAFLAFPWFPKNLILVAAGAMRKRLAEVGRSRTIVPRFIFEAIIAYKESIKEIPPPFNSNQKFTFLCSGVSGMRRTGMYNSICFHPKGKSIRVPNVSVTSVLRGIINDLTRPVMYTSIRFHSAGSPGFMYV